MSKLVVELKVEFEKACKSLESLQTVLAKIEEQAGDLDPIPVKDMSASKRLTTASRILKLVEALK